MRRFRLPTWIDAIFIVLLGTYTFAGMSAAPFHGDEGMQIYAANDYFTLVIDRAPERLSTQPPYAVDSDAHLRILNGSINRYAIGFAWQLAGDTRDDLPPRPGWQWALSYDDNAAQSYVPSVEQLTTARIPSTLLHIASIVMMFVLARSLGGRPVAYIATLIYALHPVLLLNGRRGLQESAMLCFGLLALWCAARLTALMPMPVVRGDTDAIHGVPTRDPIGMEYPKGAPSVRVHPIALWVLLALACGLTLASKHSGIVFVAGALGWMFVGGSIQLQESHERQAADAIHGVPTTHKTVGTPFMASAVLSLCASILVVLALAIGLFIALSPALWNDPLVRLGDLIAVRSDLLESQVTAAGEAASLQSRINAIVMQPFLAPLQIYEAPTFIGSAVDAQAEAYSPSRLGGIPTDNPLGIALSLCAALGIFTSVLPRLRVFTPRHTWGLLITLLIIVASLLANPLPWQRYYLPLTAILCLYAALGLQTLTRTLASFASQSRA
jgi:hypothetical protein